MKKITRPRLVRYRHILERIRQGLPGGRLPSAGILARELGVSWHTIHRDLIALRDDEGAPILYDPSRKGYVLADTGWTLRPVLLNQREVFAFSVASRMLQPFRGTPLEMDLSSLFEKIERSLEGTVTLSAEALTDQVSMIPDDYVPLDPERWASMAGHVERRSAILIRYQRFTGEEKSYALAPVHLAAYHGNWYVLACREGVEEVSTFALSRIRSVKVLPRPGWGPVEFDAAHHLREAFGITGGEQEYRVHVRASPKIATYLGERIWHPTQRLVHRKDGRLDLFMVTRGWKEMVRWVLSWQPDLEVLAPRSLRERVREKMREGVKVNGRG
ncbi:MAG TPA: WYL domain-containing protein [Kiritimatiellia bacterium]|mgnify:CR=1 FL=1|nr:WYL domain-containing protein [Kiritimatiellia bacterium]